jgi:hypothetical protein
LATGEPTGGRFLLWVDLVGGYLVCESPIVRIGQASGSNSVEIPLLADLAGHHATITRDAEGYAIAPRGETFLSERLIAGPEALVDGCELRLGRSLRMRFVRPHPLSATARLDVLSGQRTRPTTAGVLLAAETLVLGPGPQCHVVCRDWPSEVTLVRRPDGWRARYAGELEIDGKSCPSGGLLRPGSRVASGHFAFSLEAIGVSSGVGASTRP